MRGNLFLQFSLSRPWLTRSLTPFLYRSIKSCSQIANEGQRGHVSDVKAPSTADEFKRVAEERQKSEEDGSFPEQGIANQIPENSSDVSEESGASTGGEEMSFEEHKSESNK